LVDYEIVAPLVAAAPTNEPPKAFEYRKEASVVTTEHYGRNDVLKRGSHV